MVDSDPKNRSPWKIFSKVILIQGLMTLSLFCVSGIGAHYFFKDQFLSSFKAGTLSIQSIEHAVRLYDQFSVTLTAVLAFILTFFAVLLARRLVFPIGRMLVKAKSVLNREAHFEKLGEESYGEWTDLESSIEEIRRDLETKIESLTVEREEQATLMSAISDAILAIDVEGSPLFYNSRFALLFSYHELRTRKRVWEIFRDPEVLEAFQVALKEGKVSSVKALPF